MASQKITVRSASTDLAIAADQISGSLSIGSKSNRTGSIVVGSDQSTAFSNFLGSEIRVRAKGGLQNRSLTGHVASVSDNGNVTSTASAGDVKLDGQTVTLVAANAMSLQSTNDTISVENITFNSGNISRESGNIAISVDPTYSVALEGVTFKDQVVTGVTDLSVGGNLTMAESSILFTDVGNQSIDKTNGDLTITGTGIINVDAVTSANLNAAAVSVGTDATVASVILGTQAAACQTSLLAGNARLLLQSNDYIFIRAQGLAGTSNKSVTIEATNGPMYLTAGGAMTLVAGGTGVSTNAPLTLTNSDLNFTKAAAQSIAKTGGDLTISGTGVINVEGQEAVVLTSAGANVRVESLAGGGSYFGSWAGNTPTFIHDRATTAKLAIASDQTAGTVEIGTNTSRTGNIEIGNGGPLVTAQVIMMGVNMFKKTSGGTFSPSINSAGSTWTINDSYGNWARQGQMMHIDFGLDYTYSPVSTDIVTLSGWQVDNTGATLYPRFLTDNFSTYNTADRQHLSLRILNGANSANIVDNASFTSVALGADKMVNTRYIRFSCVYFCG